MKTLGRFGLAVLCVVAVLLWAGPAAASTSFPDVPSSHMYHEAITGMADQGIIGGYANGNFGPADQVTRQQFAKMIVKTLDLTVTGSEVCPFTDVQAQSGSDPFYPSKYVAVCAANSITKGTSATTFSPGNFITRAQVLTMIVRAADNLAPGTLDPIPGPDWTGGLPSYNDPTHGANIKKAEYNGLLAGINGPTGSLLYWHAADNASRGEVAQILWNLLGLMGQTALEAAWTDLALTDPPMARGGQAMVYLPGQSKVMMFAGVAQRPTGGLVFSSDCMAFDPALNSWSTLGSGAKPSGRYGHAMVYCPSTGKVILFGGDYRNDTWSFDPGTGLWTELHPSGPLPPTRVYGMMAYVPTSGKIILFGGSGPTVLTQASMKDTWAYDPVTNTWAELNPSGEPPARSDGTFVYDPVGGKIILFGGNGGTVKNDTWAYGPAANSWAKLSPAGSVPAARLGQASAFDPVNKRVIVFGGYGAGATMLNDTWAYSPATNTWTELSASTVPPARYHAAMVYEPTAGRMILYGGIGADNQTRLADTWALAP